MLNSVSYVNPVTGVTLLHAAVAPGNYRHNYSSMASFIQSLITFHPEYLNAQDVEGNTPLMYFLKDSHKGAEYLNIVEIMAEGTDLNVKVSVFAWQFNL